MTEKLAPRRNKAADSIHLTDSGPRNLTVVGTAGAMFRMVLLNV